MNLFSELNLSKGLIDALTNENILEPTPIQKQAIPYLLDGFDVIGQAQTGTGKTFAYTLPLIDRINKYSDNVEALILLPTRELSLQVSNEILKLVKGDKAIKIATIYGGESYEKQFKSLARKPNIVIGTPGRIIDMMERGKLSFENLSYLVFDEADEMLKMGFQDDLEKILKDVPQNRQTALFSATMPPFIKNMAKNYMKEPIMVKIEAKTLTVENIDEKLYYCKKDSKKDLLIRLLDYYNFKQIIIFSNTKSMVDELVVFLQHQGYKADALHGDLKQAQRDRVMSSFKNQGIDILVATDVAARGLDVSGLDAVINFDVPQENELYVHRIGRTGRRGLKGVALTISTIKNKGKIKDIENYTKRKIELSEIPSVKDIESKRQEKLYQLIVESMDNSKNIHEYDELITKLAKLSTDPIPLLNALFSMIGTSKKDYPEIEVVQTKTKNDKQRRDSKSKDKRGAKANKNEKSSKDDYIYVEVNLGSIDKIRPNQLIMFLHDSLKIHRERFGKIVIKDSKSYFELESSAVRFISNPKNLKFNGRKVIFKVIDKMPK